MEITFREHLINEACQAVVAGATSPLFGVDPLTAIFYEVIYSASVNILARVLPRCTSLEGRARIVASITLLLFLFTAPGLFASSLCPSVSFLKGSMLGWTSLIGGGMLKYALGCEQSPRMLHSRM